MAGEKELECIWYGMNIEILIDSIENATKYLGGVTDITNDYYLSWEKVQNDMNELKGAITDAQILCGVDPGTAEDVVSGRSVAESMNMLQAGIERKNTNIVFEAAVDMAAGIIRQSRPKDGHARSRLEP